MYWPVNEGNEDNYPVVDAAGEFVLVPKNYYTLYAGTLDVDFEDEKEIRTIKQAIPRMKKTMRLETGVAIASVQVGLRQRFFVLDNRLFGLEDDVYCNPEILAVSEPTFRMKEGCLSHPDTTFHRDRHPHLTLRYQDIKGNTKVLDTRKAKNSIYKQILAQAFQHEMDHLNGLDVRDGKRKASYDANLD